MKIHVIQQSDHKYSGNLFSILCSQCEMCKNLQFVKNTTLQNSRLQILMTAPGNSIAQSEMMRPEVNICFCFILITLISCKPEEHMKQNDRFCSKQGLVRNEDNNLQHFMVTVSQSKLLNQRLPGACIAHLGIITTSVNKT